MSLTFYLEIEAINQEIKKNEEGLYFEQDRQ